MKELQELQELLYREEPASLGEVRGYKMETGNEAAEISVCLCVAYITLLCWLHLFCGQLSTL